MNYLSIPHHFDKSRIGNLITFGIEFWGAEGDVIGLPLTGGITGVDARRHAIYRLIVDPTAIYTAAAPIAKVGFAPTV